MNGTLNHSSFATTFSERFRELGFARKGHQFLAEKNGFSILVTFRLESPVFEDGGPPYVVIDDAKHLVISFDFAHMKLAEYLCSDPLSGSQKGDKKLKPTLGYGFGSGWGSREKQPVWVVRDLNELRSYSDEIWSELYNDYIAIYLDLLNDGNFSEFLFEVNSLPYRIRNGVDYGFGTSEKCLAAYLAFQSGALT